MNSEVVDIHKKNGKRPYFDIYIGRRTRNTEFIEDSKWSNPRLTMEEYELYIRNGIEEMPGFLNLNELRGKILGCWCITTNKIYPIKCHGQVLMKLLGEEYKDD